MMAVDVGQPSRHPTPVVRVITTVYNGELYLEECIRSVLGQTFSDWEYLIVDNASTDSTALIAQSYADGDSRIRLIRAAEFVSAYANHNRAMRRMDPRSRYCKIIQADDLLEPECLRSDARPITPLAAPRIVCVESVMILAGGQEGTRRLPVRGAGERAELA